MPKLDKRKIMDVVVQFNPDLTYFKDHKFYSMGILGRYMNSTYIYPLDLILIRYSRDEIKAASSLAHELDHADHARKFGKLRSLYDNAFHKPTLEHSAVIREMKTLEKFAETIHYAKEVYNNKIKSMEKLKSSKNPFKALIYLTYYSGLEFEPFPEG
jgi:hypothetical protein